MFPFGQSSVINVFISEVVYVDAVFVCIIINVLKFCSFAGFYLFSDNEKDEVLDNTCLCIIVWTEAGTKVRPD